MVKGKTHQVARKSGADRAILVHVTPKDCVMQTFAAGGKGGQKQNKTATGVRFIHHPSGARGESREHRTQEANKRAAWGRMAHSEAMTIWLRVESARALGLETEAEAAVDEAMRPHNLKIERRNDDGQWEEFD